MDWYALLVLLHVVATAGLFTALGVEVAALTDLRRAETPEHGRAALRSVQQPAGGLGHLSMLVLLGTGIGMAVRRGLEPWTATALGAIVMMIAVAMTQAQPALKALAAALADGGPAEAWQRHSRGMALPRSLVLRIALLIGILALMALKPGWPASLLLLAAAIALGVVVLPAITRRWTVADQAAAGEAMN